MRIYNKNLEEYINKNYPGATLVKSQTYYGKPYYLQKNYGGANDCTLMSISYTIKKLYSNYIISDIYNKVEAAAKCFLYKENIGTIPVFINSIIKKAYGLKAEGKLIKNVGFTAKTIIKKLEKSPVILSIFSDGNSYYKNHSITVVGYKQYNFNNKPIYLFEVRDNWNSDSSYVDYQKMCNISSINYIG